MRVVVIVLSVAVLCGCQMSGLTPPTATSTAHATSIFTCTSCPSIAALSPSSAMAGSADVTIHITGTNFIQAEDKRTWALWTGDVSLDTQFVSGTELTAIIPASLLHDPGIGKISLETNDVPGDGNGMRSNVVSFTVVPAASR